MRDRQAPDQGHRQRGRTRGRMIVEGLWCDVGEILDLSAGGMRVRARRASTLGEKLTLRIESARICLTLHATCAWAKREGSRKWDLGFAFENTDGEQLRLIGELALIHAARLEASRAA
ncbi:MAG: PilZ domain-containing protein [Phycisphaerales bacterium]